MKPKPLWRRVSDTGSYQEVSRVRLQNTPEGKPQWAVHFCYGHKYVDFLTGEVAWHKNESSRLLPPTPYPPYTVISEHPWPRA